MYVGAKKLSVMMRCPDLQQGNSNIINRYSPSRMLSGTFFSQSADLLTMKSHILKQRKQRIISSWFTNKNKTIGITGS